MWFQGLHGAGEVATLNQIGELVLDGGGEGVVSLQPQWSSVGGVPKGQDWLPMRTLA